MKFFIESISGKKGYKSFETLEDFTDFMTRKGHLVKELKEADLPYTDKPVKLPKVSKSKGWSEVSDFGEVGEEAEKGESLIASTSKSVMKDEANFEMSKSSGKADKQEMGLGAEKGDIDMSDFKSFEYEEPKLKSTETKESAPKNEEPKSEEKSESKGDKKETNKSSEKKENKEEKMNKHDKDIAECLKAAGVQLNEFFKFNNTKSNYDDVDDYKKNSFIESMIIYSGAIKDELIYPCCKKFFAKLGSRTLEQFKKATSPDMDRETLFKVIGDHCDLSTLDMLQDALDYCSRYGKLQEGIKDYLPRAGFIRDNDEDKDSQKMGIWGGQGTDDQLKKAKIIAKVKFANGDRMGRVTSDDLKHFDEYKRQYDEIYGSMDESLEEGWKDKLKKGAATLGVAASLAGNAMANDSMYDGARDPSTNDYTQEYSQSVESDYEAPKMVSKKGNMIIDQFGNEWTSDEWKKLSNGESPMYDGARNPNIEESLDEEIAECLRAAGC